MPRRVLIVSPHFPPINAADHQRVRMSLPYLQACGWQAHILAVQPEQVEGGVLEVNLEKTVVPYAEVSYVHAFPVWISRRLGIGNLGLRAILPLLIEGNRLLRENSFDLVFFSSTVFQSMILGSIWKRRFGVPYVLDFQDPWLSDYYSQSGAPLPPGGRLKYGFSQLQAKVLEPIALKAVDHVVSVSPAYPDMLQRRYSHLRQEQFSVIPFGAPEKDFEILPQLQVEQKIFNPNDGKRHWVYVGRGGQDMAFALQVLFGAIAQDRKANPDRWASIKLHFVGTSYAPKHLAKKTIEPIACSCGVADLVEEYPYRIPYFEALKLLCDSDAIVMIGSNDAAYTASKLYPCILARKPILAIFHQASTVVDILETCQAGAAIPFGDRHQPHDLYPETIAQLRHLASLPRGYRPHTHWPAFEPYTAKAMTAYQCQIFDRCLAHPRPVLA